MTNVTLTPDTARAYNEYMASDKQIAFHNSLLDEIVRLAPDEFDTATIAACRESFPTLDTAKASATLTTVIATRDRVRAARPTSKPVSAAPVAGLDLTGLPAGTYAVPNGDTRLKVEIDAPAKGKWAGWVFVKDGAVYGEGQRYGSQRPGQAYHGKIEAELRAIAADPQAAMAAYGHLTNTCGRCHRPLEDEDSVARGIGPVCLGKMGW